MVISCPQLLRWRLAVGLRCSAVQGAPRALLRQDRHRSEGGPFPVAGARRGRVQERRLFVRHLRVVFCRENDLITLRLLMANINRLEADVGI